MDCSEESVYNETNDTSFVSPATPQVSVRRSRRTPQSINLGQQHVTSSDVESDGDSVKESEETPQEKETEFTNKIISGTYLKIDPLCVPDRNIIIPLRSLMHMITKQFKCRSCRKVSSRMTFELETFGIANSFHCRCNCGLQSSASAVIRPSSVEKTMNVPEGDCLHNKVNSMDFDLNYKILLGLQLGGGGRQELKNICAMLNIANNPMSRWITEAREQIGLHILKIANEILAQNLQHEKILSPEDDNGTKLLAVSHDARWDKRSSGRRYDSMSGCSVMAGNRTKLIIGLEAMSAKCVKCDKNIPHTFENCSHNYDGSSKGMEATGALALVKRITKKENECWVREYVSDDDSTSRALLTHSWQDLIDSGLMDVIDWPKYNSKTLGEGKGKKKEDIGLLPIEHPEITTLADKNHRNRNYAKPFFALARMSKSKNFGTTNIDAERMKRRMSWTLRLWSGGTFEEFKTAVLAVLEHHFDNHEYCGDWCKAKIIEGKEREEHAMRFRCKKENKEMYERFKEIHDEFMDEKLLRQLHHQWDTNAVEGFNMLLTKFLPKDRNFATTIENKVRIHLAMSLLSIGYERFYKRLFESFGLTTGEYLIQFLKSEDRERGWRRNYRKKTSVKIARMKRLYKKIQEGRKKLAEDKRKGKSYSSGMMGPSCGLDVDEEAPSSKKAKTTSGECKHCGLSTHSRITSKLCPKNPTNIARCVEEEDGIESDGESSDEDSLSADFQKSSSKIVELDELEKFEEVSFDDDIGEKYGDEDST